jgi:hypothetical protein
LRKNFYRLLRIFRLLFEVLFVSNFISNYFLIYDNEDEIHEIQVDSNQQYIYILTRQRNSEYLCAYSTADSSVSLFAKASNRQAWMYLSLSQFDDEIVLSSFNIVTNRSNLLIFDIHQRKFTDSLIYFTDNPIYPIFFNGRDNIIFTAYNPMIKYGSPIGGGGPRGFNLFDYDRGKKTVRRITNYNAYLYRKLSNFREDTIILNEFHEGQIMHKLGRDNPDEFLPILEFASQDDEKLKSSILQFKYLDFCNYNSMIYFLHSFDVFQMHADTLQAKYLVTIASKPNEIKDFKVTKDGKFLLFVRTQEADKIYRYDLEKREMASPIELKYPKSMRD